MVDDRLATTELKRFCTAPMSARAVLIAVNAPSIDSIAASAPATVEMSRVSKPVCAAPAATAVVAAVRPDCAVTPPLPATTIALAEVRFRAPLTFEAVTPAPAALIAATRSSTRAPALAAVPTSMFLPLTVNALPTRALNELATAGEPLLCTPTNVAALANAPGAVPKVLVWAMVKSVPSALLNAKVPAAAVPLKLMPAVVSAEAAVPSAVSIFAAVTVSLAAVEVLLRTATPPTVKVNV